MIKSTLAAVCLAGASLLAGAAFAADEPEDAKDVSFSFEGAFGVFDPGQLQRGFLVYKDVCAACHSLSLLAYRNLGDAGGPEFSEAQVKAIAAAEKVTDGPNDEGKMFERPGKPSDRIVKPFPNEQAARVANGGSLPPDLSLITKARAGWHGHWYTLYTTHLLKGIGGPEYVYSLLTGYQKAPEALAKEQPAGKEYNPYFASGHWIGMPPPLNEGAVTYGDGTKASVDQMAMDVSAFLAWAAEPKMVERKRLGFTVLIYLAVFSVLMYLVKKKIWAGIPH
jgi:cytochrome c1